MQEPARPIDRIVVLDPPGGVLDRYVESFQLEHLNLTRRIARTADRLANAAAFDELQRACFGEQYVLRLMTVPAGAVPLEELSRSSGLGHTLVFARAYQRSQVAQVQVQGIPAAASDSEFDAKVGGHLSRIVRMQPVGSAFNPVSLPFPSERRVYCGLNELEPVVGERHTVRVELGGVPYEYFSDLRPGSRNLVVFGQSAIGGRSQVQLPLFHRWKWMVDLDPATSAIAWNDPTLYLDPQIEGGWWVGTRERDYVLDAVAIVTRIAQRMGIAARNVIFYGGSAGGFSSFQMAACMPGSKVMADIPQIDLRKYHQRSAIDAAVRAGLGFRSVEEVPPSLLHRIDVIARFEQRRHVPDFLYLQNVRDTSHVLPHFEDFKRRLADLARHHAWARADAWYETYAAWSLLRGGHFPLSRHDTMAWLNRYLAASPNRVRDIAVDFA